MGRIALAVLLATLAVATIAGAAEQAPVASGTLQSGADPSLSCDDGVVAVQFTDTAPSVFGFEQATVSGLDGACEGATIHVLAAGRVSGPGIASGGVAVCPFSPSVGSLPPVVQVNITGLAHGGAFTAGGGVQ